MVNGVCLPNECEQAICVRLTSGHDILTALLVITAELNPENVKEQMFEKCQSDFSVMNRMSKLAAPTGGPECANRLIVSFKAGRSVLEPGDAPTRRKVVAEPAKGICYVTHGSDQMPHFYWKNRESGGVVEDHIVMPGSEFKAVEGCPDGKVYCLKLFGSDRKDFRFYWIQEPDVDKDLVEKVNDAMNKPLQSVRSVPLPARASDTIVRQPAASARNKQEWSKSEMLVNGAVRLTLYKSKRFVTETDSDDGLPHTLQHLIVMGSKKYIATGTNAWTVQNHAAYTLSTLGIADFLKLLPCYVHYLLLPSLTDSQFETEVHHINGDGDDGGVIYNHMQQHESDMDRIMYRRMKEMLYPPGNSYAVDSRGLLKNLRDSCDIEKVRSFHNQFYHLSNMLVTVCGKINHEQLLDIMSAIEEEHLTNIPHSTSHRPFSTKLQSLSDFTETRAVCPSDDETRGSVNLTWFAPENYDAYMACSLKVLFDYLTNTADSPMQKDFVLNDDPLARLVYFENCEQNGSAIHLHFTGVPMGKLGKIKNRLLSKTVAEHMLVETWAMERMSFLIEQTIQNEFVELDLSGHHHQIFQRMIGYQLFDSENVAKLEERFDQKEGVPYWIQLLELFKEHNACVIGVPDKKMVDQIANEEKKRIEEQKTNLGENGLKLCGQKLAAAIHENSTNNPSARLPDQLIVKDLERFNVFNVHRMTNSGEAIVCEVEAIFLKQFPFPAVLHNIESQFIEQRGWLMLFNNLMFVSPAIINGTPYLADKVAELCRKDLVKPSLEIGVASEYDQLLNFRFKVGAWIGMRNLAKWMEVFTLGIIFEADLVKMCAQNWLVKQEIRKRMVTPLFQPRIQLWHIQEVSSLGDDDYFTVRCTAFTNSIIPDSNSHLYDSIILEDFHEKIAKLCDEKPEEVIGRLEELRTAILKNGVNMHILCDTKLLDPSNFLPDIWTFAKEKFGKSEIFKTKNDVDEFCIGYQIVIPVDGCLSSFIYQSCCFDCDWQGDSLLPTMLFSKYLSQCEGLLWHGIRESGLAYVADIFVECDRNIISLSLSQCAQPLQDYEQTKKIVTDIISSNKVETSEFEAAKRSFVYSIVEMEGTVSSSGELSILGALRKTDSNFNRTLCEDIWNMSAEHMLEFGGPSLSNLFENYVRAIAVPPSNVPEIKKAVPGITAVDVSCFCFEPSSYVTRSE